MDEIEETARLENEAVEAMMVLVGDYGYTEDDLNNLVKNALSG